MPERLINIDRKTPMLLPPDLRDWLPEDHLVHFIIEVVEMMDLSNFDINHRGTGSAQYPPSMLLALLIYCYSTGRFSSRVIEEASWYDVAVRYICAETHPDHDTICRFRQRNAKAFKKLFVHVLEVAAESKVMKKVGTVSIDGTKIKANASKHSAVSYGRANEMVEQLESEVALLNEKAEQADRSMHNDCEVNLPDEIALREQRKSRLEGAKLYKLRKQTVEPVFGIIKQCMRFRQFLMRGQEKVANEWNLVCTAYNLKRISNQRS